MSSYALLAHCITCTKCSLAAVRVSKALTGRGYGVLRFDFTGLGQSGGEFADSSLSGSIADVVAAAAATRGRPAALLIGHSSGGAAVLVAAGQIPEARTVATIGLSADVEYVTRLFAGDIEELRAKGEAEVRIGGRPLKSASSRYSESRCQRGATSSPAWSIPMKYCARPTCPHQRSKFTQRADSKHKADFALVLPGGHSYEQQGILKALLQRNREQ